MARHNTDYENLKPSDEQKKSDESLTQLFIMLVMLTLFFYFVPYLLLSTGEKPQALYILILSGFYPVVVFMCGFLHGKKNGFIWYVPLMIGIFFAPTSLIIYKDFRFATFALMYVLLGYFGELGSYLLVTRRKKKNHAPIGANYAVKRSMKHYNKKAAKKNNK